MPKVTGIFDSFDDLDQITAEDIASWLRPAPELFYLENYLANRLLYPQVAPVTAVDMSIDLAILREALKRSTSFYDSKDKKITIPQHFVSRIPNLSQLIWAFADAFKLKDVTTVVLSGDDKDEVLGSLLTPQLTQKQGLVKLKIEEKNYDIKLGTLTIIPCSKSRCHVGFKSDQAQILGKNEALVETYGGKLGLVVDGRGR